ncbi:hypothetical protein ACFPM0_13780 [Pseudonocardia sulfidoxydans]|uniref:hypothetical protein n=1 Tax=Pseudonocardia sulfidoxydans TaxID=54011 RepID=UPI00360AFB49
MSCNPGLNTLGQDRLFVLDGFGNEKRVRIVAAAALGERGRRHLLAVADHDDRAGPPHRADGIGDSHLRRLVEHHDVEQIGLRREEAGQRVRTDKDARHQVRDQIAVRGHQFADLHTAAAEAELAPELTHPTARRVRVESPAREHPPRQHRPQMVPDLVGRALEATHGPVVGRCVETVEAGVAQALGDGGAGGTELERQPRPIHVDRASKDLRANLVEPLRAQWLDLAQQIEPRPERPEVRIVRIPVAGRRAQTDQQPVGPCPVRELLLSDAARVGKFADRRRHLQDRTGVGRACGKRRP